MAQALGFGVGFLISNFFFLWSQTNTAKETSNKYFKFHYRFQVWFKISRDGCGKGLKIGRLTKHRDEYTIRKP